MNDRKRQVIEKAHQLFIEKGFHATSIQDILDYSGISKGTFYNYFSTKNELLMDIFRIAFKKMEKGRNALLIGQNPSDPEVFISQIEFQMTANRENKIIPLFEEVFFSGDKELKHFIETGQMKSLRWVCERLADITEDVTHPFLLDAAIMLNGILLQHIRYHRKAHGEAVSIQPVVRYSVTRTLNLLEQVAKTGEQLLPPEILEKWLPSFKTEDLDWRTKIHSVITKLRKTNNNDIETLQKLDFIQEEILKSKEPRKFLIDAVLLSLSSVNTNDLNDLKELVDINLLEKT